MMARVTVRVAQSSNSGSAVTGAARLRAGGPARVGPGGLELGLGLGLGRSTLFSWQLEPWTAAVTVTAYLQLC